MLVKYRPRRRSCSPSCRSPVSTSAAASTRRGLVLRWVARKLGVVNLNFSARGPLRLQVQLHRVLVDIDSPSHLDGVSAAALRTYLMATMPTKTKDDRQQRLTWTTALAFFALTYMVFPSVSVTIFRTFQCDEDISDTDGYDNPDRRLGYMRADYSIPCRGMAGSRTIRAMTSPNWVTTACSDGRSRQETLTHVSGIDTYNAARITHHDAHLSDRNPAHVLRVDVPVEAFDRPRPAGRALRRRHRRLARRGKREV